MDGETKNLTALADQAAEEIKQFAPIMWSYFNALVAQGFTRQEALELTMGYQAALVAIAKRGK